MNSEQILVVGAGPTGLTLACELGRRGVPFRLIDALPGPARGSRAKSLQPRTLEVLDDLSVVDQAIAGGRFHLQLMHYDASGVGHVRELHQDHHPRPDAPYGSPLMIPQWRTESIFRDALAALGGKVEYATELTALSQDEEGVTAILRRGEESETVRLAWVVGCDGGHSRTRTLLGVPFSGETNEAHRALLGDVRATGLDRDYWHGWGGAGNFLALAPLPHTDLYQLQASISLDDPREPSLQLMQRIVDERTGRSDIRLSDPEWMSMWRANVRMVDRYRVGRVLLAGDAAHIHSPAGGQGMNTGIGDAYNLGWKLAAVLRGADTALIDTYQEERLPIAAWVLGVSGKLHRQGYERQAGQDTRRSTETYQLGLGYRGSSLAWELRAEPTGVRAGDRAPDAPGLRTVEGDCRLFDLMRGTHFTLLTFGEGWEELIGTVQARFATAVRGFAVGTHASGHAIIDTQAHASKAYGVSGPTLFLIRPDGYVGLAMEQPHSEPLMRYLSAQARLLP